MKYGPILLSILWVVCWKAAFDEVKNQNIVI